MSKQFLRDWLCILKTHCRVGMLIVNTTGKELVLIPSETPLGIYAAPILLFMREGMTNETYLWLRLNLLGRVRS